MFNYQQKTCAFLCYRYTFSVVGMKRETRMLFFLLLLLNNMRYFTFVLTQVFVYC